MRKNDLSIDSVQHFTEKLVLIEKKIEVRRPKSEEERRKKSSKFEKLQVANEYQTDNSNE